MDAAIDQLLTQTRIHVRVTPHTKKTRITKIDGNTLHLDVAAPPEDGKANKEIERYLTRITGKKATITLGKTGKDKTVKLD